MLAPREHAALEALVGRWRSQGRTVDAPPVAIEGSDDYQWHPGGFFLVHRVDVRFGDQQVDVLEIIGPYDPARGGFPMRSFDHQGQVGEMLATVDGDGRWTFAGDSERATLTIDDDGQRMTARWEQRRDGAWAHWMDMTFTRDR